MTIGIIVKKIVSDYVLYYAYDKIAEKVIVNRIEKKLEEKFGIRFGQTISDKKIVKTIKKTMEEELRAYTPEADVDQFVKNAFGDLIHGQEEILQRLTNLEDLIQEISLILSNYNNLQLPNSSQKLTEDLMAQYLIGEKKSVAVLDEWRKEGLLDQVTIEILSKYAFLTKERKDTQNRVTIFLEELQKDITAKKLNELKALVEMTYLLGGPSSTTQEKLDSLVIELIKNEDFRKDMETIIAVLHILDRMNKTDEIGRKLKQLLAKKLHIEAKIVEDDSIRLESLYFALKLDPSLKFPQQEVQSILERARKYGTSSYRIKRSIPLKRRIIRFLTGKGYKSSLEIKYSLKNLERLIKRLNKRKFARSTHILLAELDRVSQELNLISLDLETVKQEEFDLIEIEDLPYLIENLIQILENPKIKKLPMESRIKVMTCIDNAIHLQDQLALLNSKKMLEGSLEALNIAPSVVLKDARTRARDKKRIKEALLAANIGKTTKIDVDKELRTLPKPKRKKKAKNNLKA